MAQDAAAASNLSDVRAIVADGTAKFQAFLANAGTAHEVLASYDAALGIPIPTKPNPPPSPGPTAGASKSMDRGAIAAIVIGSSVGLLVLCAGLVFLVARANRRTFFGRAGEPLI